MACSDTERKDGEVVQRLLLYRRVLTSVFWTAIAMLPIAAMALASSLQRDPHYLRVLGVITILSGFATIMMVAVGLPKQLRKRAFAMRSQLQWEAQRSLFDPQHTVPDLRLRRVIHKCEDTFGVPRGCVRPWDLLENMRLTPLSDWAWDSWVDYGRRLRKSAANSTVGSQALELAGALVSEEN